MLCFLCDVFYTFPMRIYSNSIKIKTFIMNWKYNTFKKMNKIKKFQPIPTCLTVKKSKIHGLGLFASKEIKRGVELGISHVKDDRFLHGYIRTSLGGFFNHSETPNCEALYENDLIKLKTINFIRINEEVTVDYMKHNWIAENN